MGTWDFVVLPPEKKLDRCRWVYTLKLNPNGSFARLKDCLIAKGYSQVYQMDYQDTFSLAAKLTSVQILFSLTATHH